MKMSKPTKSNEQYKILRMISRNEQFERNGGGQFVAINRVFKNKSKYNRNDKKKELRNDLNSFCFLLLQYVVNIGLRVLHTHHRTFPIFYHTYCLSSDNIQNVPSQIKRNCYCLLLVRKSQGHQCLEGVDSPLSVCLFYRFSPKAVILWIRTARGLAVTL